MSYVLSKKTVSTAKGVGVSSEKYPKLHLVDVMSDTWYPTPLVPNCRNMRNDLIFIIIGDVLQVFESPI